MPHSFWLMIATTPWWVYFLLAYFIRVSLFVTKPRMIPIKPLYYAGLPLVAMTMLSCIIAPPSNTALLLSGPLLLTGVLFGVARAKWQGIKAIPHQNTLLLPGSWLMFIAVIALFLIRQYAVYNMNVNLLWLIKAHGDDYFLPLYAITIGIYVSQLLYCRRLIQQGPYATTQELTALQIG